MDYMFLYETCNPYLHVSLFTCFFMDSQILHVSLWIPREANIEKMGLTTPIIVVCGLPSVSKETEGTLKCGWACWGSRPSLARLA
jgi:hypothetical protein